LIAATCSCKDGLLSVVCTNFGHFYCLLFISKVNKPFVVLDIRILARNNKLFEIPTKKTIPKMPV
jgi:hypothetical protein